MAVAMAVGVVAVCLFVCVCVCVNLCTKKARSVLSPTSRGPMDTWMAWAKEDPSKIS